MDRVENEFITTAWHDLINPIVAISGVSQLLSATGPLNSQQHEFFERIQPAAEHMRELLENMLALARIDADMEHEREAVDMDHIVTEIAQECELQASIKDQAFVVKTLQNNAHVYGNPLQLKLALRNLVGNATKYTITDGIVSPSVDSQQYTVLVRIKDYRYGIPTGDLPPIFDRSYRVRAGAVKKIKRLDLAIVKSIIESRNRVTSISSFMSSLLASFAITIHSAP